jgi:hypothetical protein
MKNKKRKKNAASAPSAYLGVKAWAYFVRYGMDLLPLPFLILAKAGQIPERAGLLIAAGLCLFTALYYFVGYQCRWRHMYCVWQSIAHRRMTPDKVNWSKVDKKQATGLPLCMAVIAVLLALAALFT